jgi:predicted transcriptional regulator
MTPRIGPSHPRLCRLSLERYALHMTATRTIEIDTETADQLEARAASRGVSVRQMVADLVALDSSVAPETDELAGSEAQWAAIESGAVQTVPHEKVARWLETWGTPAFKPWRDQ